MADLTQTEKLEETEEPIELFLDEPQDPTKRTLSTNEQKIYIMRHSDSLSIKVKNEICGLIKTKFGIGPIFINSDSNKEEVNIDLNMIEANSPTLLNHIYNKVESRIRQLSTIG